MRARISNYHTHLFATAAMAAIALPPAALAQEDASADSPIEEADAEDDFSSNAIIVTATKREQTLQDVPVAVTVTDATTIERANITDLKDLQSVVPSLRVQTLQNAVATNFFIRGFGNGANAAGIEPSVGVFIDGVYRSRSGSAISDLNNIQRVEVLRGPQSTLFGKNASAGVISIATRKPEFYLNGKVEATLGNYDLRRFRGYINVPISEDKAAFSLSLNRNQRDGYFVNTFNDTDVNNVDRWSVAADFLLVAADNIELRIKADYDEIDEDCCVVGELQPGLGNFVIPLLGGAPLSTDPYSYEVSQDIQPLQDISNRGVSFHAEVEFDNVDLTSITSYRENRSFTSVDTDFSSAQIFEVSPTVSAYDTFTQEVRLASNYSGPFNWLLGGFFFHETIDIDSQVLWGTAGRPYFQILSDAAFMGLLPPTSIADAEMELGLPAGTFFAPGTGSFEEFYQSNDAISIFTQVDFEVTDTLTVTGGLNYTHDKKTVELGSRLQPDAFSNADLSGLSGTLPFLSLLQFLPELVSLPNANEPNTSSDEDVSWAIRASWEPIPEINLYGTVATGFKATSWSLSRDTRPGARFAQPEDTTLYEIGAKARFDTLTINLALFDQSIEDFQTTIFTGTGFAFQNAEKQSSRGFEIESNWRPFEGFSLSNAVTYLDAEYDSFPNFGDTNAGGGLDLSGERPAGVPKWAVSTAITYEHEFDSGWSAYIRGDYQYESTTILQDNIRNFSRNVNEFNASLGVEMPNGLQLQVWGRNLTNDEYYVGAIPVAAQGGRLAGYPSVPRTYGASAIFEF